jgi:hypothetical protein
MNTGKAQLDFILDFPIAMEAFCRVKELGMAKYDRDNWKLGGKPDAEYLAACLRHMMAHASGELYASDSGCLHLAHAMWNLAALIELNVKETHDAELFTAMVAHWKRFKEADGIKDEKATEEIPAIDPSLWSKAMLKAAEEWLAGSVKEAKAPTDKRDLDEDDPDHIIRSSN